MCPGLLHRISFGQGMYGPCMVRRVLQESALHDVFVVVLDDTGRSENEKMNMTVLNALCQCALIIMHGNSGQVGVMCLRGLAL